MSQVSVSAVLLEKQAQYINEVNPQLEKLAAERELFDQQVPSLIDAMVTQGVLKADSRDAAVRELCEGGLAKAAEVMQYLVSTIQPRRLGDSDPVKRASSAPVRGGERESDRLFAELITR